MRWKHSFFGVQEETGKVRSFFIDFYMVNPALSSGRPVFGQHPYNKKNNIKPSYFCVKAGCYPDGAEPGLQLSTYYSVDDLFATPDPLVMKIGDCLYSEERLRGHVEVDPVSAGYSFMMSDAGSMEWDLEVQKAVSCHSGLLGSKLFELLNALDAFWHGEGIKTFFRGTVSVNGEVYRVSPSDCHGYADKHWGHSFNHPWLSLSSSNLISEKTGQALRHSAFAVSGCCPRFFFIPLRRKLLLQLTYTGEDYEFGFTPSLLSRCAWKTKSTNKRYIWHIKAQDKDITLKISGSCAKENMLRLKYESPDGILRKTPLLAGSGFAGTIEIYKKTDGSEKLVDTLRMENGYCEYQKEIQRKK